jgi:hypothetical protein
VFNIRKAFSYGQWYYPRFADGSRHGVGFAGRCLSVGQDGGVIALYGRVDAFLDAGPVQLMCRDAGPVHMIQCVRMSPTHDDIDAALRILNHRILTHDRPGVLLLLLLLWSVGGSIIIISVVCRGGCTTTTIGRGRFTGIGW